MNLRFWKKKSPPDKPSITFVVEENDVINIICNFPILQENNKVIANFVSLISLMQKGALLPLIQYAISEAGSRTNQPDISKTILVMLDKVLNEQDPKELVVKPEEMLHG